MERNKHIYVDYIIVGGGCAGLSLLNRMADNPFFYDKSILLIESELKSTNDRTWCFWENKPGYYDAIVKHSWPNLNVKGVEGSLSLKLNGYQYKMIRSEHFYSYCKQHNQTLPRLNILQEKVTHINAHTGEVVTSSQRFIAKQFIFSSINLNPPPTKHNDIKLLQHFKGWWIKTESATFDYNVADLMNFNVRQDLGTAFMYVLPISSTEALVEYTFFNEQVVSNEIYNNGLKLFIKDQLKIADYIVTEEEQGIIPMSTQTYPTGEGKLWYIGTAGGQTKASTGYTFQFIQKHSQAIIQALVQGKFIGEVSSSKRFNFYDKVLLRVLKEQKLAGCKLFYQLFARNPADSIFRFLDNETSLKEELTIMNSTPKLIFIPAAIKSVRY